MTAAAPAPSATRPGYLHRILAVDSKPGTVAHVTVEHDWNCAQPPGTRSSTAAEEAVGRLSI